MERALISPSSLAWVSADQDLERARKMSVYGGDEKDGIKAHETGADVEGGHVLAMGTQDVFGEDESGVDPVYQAKARVLNDAFQEIGMGKYQVSMTCLK